MSSEPHPRGAEDSAIDMRPSGPAGTLLLATPRGSDVKEAEERGEWLVGRGVEVRQ